MRGITETIFLGQTSPQGFLRTSYQNGSIRWKENKYYFLTIFDWLAFWEQCIDEIEISPSPLLKIDGCCNTGEIWYSVEQLSEILPLFLYSTEACASTSYTFYPWTMQKIFFTSRKRDKDRWEIISILYSHGEETHLSNNDESKEGKSKIMNQK